MRADLRSSCGDGIAFGGMVGLGETYLSAFVLAVGLGELTAGLVGSLPLVAGGIMQTISPSVIRMLRSHKRWVILCAVIQAISFLPLILAACWGRISGPAVFAVATVYWGAGLATGPAWNTWIGTLVPRVARPRFFAIRTRGQQAAVFLGFLAGGIGLQVAASHNRLMVAYAVLFATAGLCRLVSAWMLACQREPTPIPANMRDIPWRELLQHLRRRPGGRLLVYLVTVQAAVQLAGPYFTPFMFEKLHLSYAQFVALISIAFLAKVIAVPVWGRVARQIGAYRLLWLGGIGITPLSAGWILSQDVSWLMLLQIAAGVTWAAYELAFFLLFFESIPEEERTSLLTLYNLINTMAWVGGALLGGALLYASGASYISYLFIFATSTAGRCLSLLLLARVPALDVAAHHIAVRTAAVRPTTASLDFPILPSLPEQVGTSDSWRTVQSQFGKPPRCHLAKLPGGTCPSRANGSAIQEVFP